MTARLGERIKELPRWFLVTVLISVFAVILVVAGFAGAQVGNDHAAHDAVANSSVPVSVVDGGPVILDRQGSPFSIRLPTQTIALTFDDGPDPTWTPRVLAVLKKYHVPATFFVVGARAARNPGLIAQIHRSGSELGVHTFTHPDLITVAPWQFDRELSDTQFTLAGAAGVTSTLMRPPYSSVAGAIDNLGYRTVERAGSLGYTSVFTDVDSEDWQRPGVNAIVANSTPRDYAGAVVLMHDAGGDRAQTVAALDRLIPLLQQQGYRFTTVSDGAGLPPGNVPAGATDRTVGGVLLATAGVSLGVVGGLQWILVGAGVLVVARIVLMVAVARVHAKRRHHPDFSWGEPVTEPVSVIVPAYNERANIEATLRSILANDHPLEVIVVDDGSSDGTADVVEELGLPGVRLIRQANSGKAGALNTGIAAARYELIVMMDGDTVFEPTTVRRIVRPFADPTVGAVAGNVKIANTATLLGRLQHIEYVIGFNVDRRVHDLAGSMPTIPGAAGAFRRRALVDVGGLSHDTLAEDTDLTIAIGRVGWRVVYTDDAVAWTEAPATLRQLWQQRFRWTYGTMQAVWKHRAAMRERGRAGRLGRLGLAHLTLFQIVLPLSAPAIDIFLVYGLFFLNPVTTVLLWSTVMIIQLGAGALAFRWDGEPPGTLWVMPLQQVIYRQLMYIVLVQSVVAALSGVRVRWQKLRRTGGLDQLLAAFQRQSAADPVARNGTPVSTADIRPMSSVPPVPSDQLAADIPPPTPKVRERWLDLLRAIALCRVIVYHALGFGWLSWVFPAMGVMFALAGSLMVASIRRTPAIDVIGGRLRRLLPPLWLLGLIVVPVMFWHGWSRGASNPLQLLLWLFPVLDPPGSRWAADATVVLWYIRAYLWFVLLTPLLLRVFRARPVVALAIPLALVAVDAFAGSPLKDAGKPGPVLLDFGTFGACWMLGFAHREGMLRRLRLPVALAVAVPLIGLGAVWAARTGTRANGYDLNEIPLAQALVSIGVVLLVLRATPRMDWLDRIPVLSWLVTALNARAISVYLWHNIAIGLAQPIDDRLGWESPAITFGTAVVLTVVAVLAFGWVEDLAARRPRRIIPGRRKRPGPKHAAGRKPSSVPVPLTARTGHRAG